MRNVLLALLMFVIASCTVQKNSHQPPINLTLPEDIPLPREMKIVYNKSCLVKVLNSKAKHFVFKAKVTGNSLFDYYMTLMRQKNWQLKGYVRCKEPIIIFEKYPRICIILIEEKSFNTYLHIFELKDVNFLKKIPIFEENISK